jgi:hypothetical protein
MPKQESVAERRLLCQLLALLAVGIKRLDGLAIKKSVNPIRQQRKPGALHANAQARQENNRFNDSARFFTVRRNRDDKYLALMVKLRPQN